MSMYLIVSINLSSSSIWELIVRVCKQICRLHVEAFGIQQIKVQKFYNANASVNLDGVL